MLACAGNYPLTKLGSAAREVYVLLVDGVGWDVKPDKKNTRKYAARRLLFASRQKNQHANDNIALLLNS